MNIKRYLAAAVVLFVFILAYEYFVNVVLLMDIYNQTPTIWRNYTEMQTYAPFNTGIMILLALWITFIFTRLFREGGWKNGLAFGLYMGVLAGIQAAGAYFYLPISETLAGYWFLSYLVESLLGGLLVGLIYHQDT